ncbi:assimilatory sulfite reductase (NADPH) flavoprotein subunit [Aliikangiella marina]|uniref:Sulfite reductase [NADPH] flavoprotein alpha-component n=1 Tax=Aliikangiella marina TaxID=1712262 RepID=A0A545TJZ9_9GAMM|nr:assimilatory sulfite reductase (NADPH) flavoprotein subunit [Aliikangiella marina]
MPLGGELLSQLQQFEAKELYWLSGYASGLADAKGESAAQQAENNVSSPVTAQPMPAQRRVIKKKVVKPVALSTQVLYASQSGNSQKVAESLHQSLGQKGLKANLASVADFKPAKLKDQQVILMVAATHGEGEPPDDAIDFHEVVLGKRAPKLTGSKHAVLSLGDSSYEFFCQTGKDFDKAFSQAGSQALLAREDLDVDFEAQADAWILKVVEKVSALASQGETVEVEELVDVEVNDTYVDGDVQVTDESTQANSVPEVVYDKDNPFTATILGNQKITGRGSSKHINHIEISLEGSGITYQPGDSLGIWPKNNAASVEMILKLAELTGEEELEYKGKTASIRKLLSERLEITLLNKGFIQSYAEIVANHSLKTIAEENFAEFAANNQVIDVLNIAPTKLTAEQLVNLLKPIKPRMYSIASSLSATPDEVHLTVGLKVAENQNGERFGAASHFLIDSLKEDDQVLVFVEANRHFKLPDDQRPVIMIGPGTGIAPFRSFLQERQESEADSDSWLFFGNPHFNTDFLYQTELQDFLKDKTLSKLDVAFSRDQHEKIYVQDRLRENAEELWKWIDQDGAAIYVCGDMSRMAKDVEAELLKTFIEQGSLNQDQAKDYLKSLKKTNRYQRDVY